MYDALELPHKTDGMPGLPLPITLAPLASEWKGVRVYT